MRSKGDVSRVFLATVSHGIGFLFLFSFAACFAVRGFRACGRLFFLFFSFFLGSVGNVSTVFCLRFRSVLGRFGLGFRWCSVVSGRLPSSLISKFSWVTDELLTSSVRVFLGY